MRVVALGVVGLALVAVSIVYVRLGRTLVDGPGEGHVDAPAVEPADGPAP